MIKHAKNFDTWSLCPDRRGLVSVGRVLNLAFMAALAVTESRAAIVSCHGAWRRHHLRGLLDHQPAASRANPKAMV